ncbi:hypothetical protein pb186bvf_007024 [Paramecium bursaria]
MRIRLLSIYQYNINNTIALQQKIIQICIKYFQSQSIRNKSKQFRAEEPYKQYLKTKNL